MTLAELKEAIDLELERRPASGLSVVLISQACGDVGHYGAVLGVEVRTDQFGQAFTLTATPAECCELLQQWHERDAAEARNKVAKMPADGVPPAKG